MTKLPSITQKQQTILSLLFRFRFLNRIQIQKFLKHKDHKTSNDWLKDLTQKEYINRLYESSFPGNTKPAVYHIGKYGIGFLKAQHGGDLKLVKNLYREEERTTDFIDHSLLLADICLDLQARSDRKVEFTMSVKSDYAAHPHGELLCTLSPHAFIEQSRNGETERYFLEILADLPVIRLRQRIKKYFSFYEGNEWEGATGEPFPAIMVICPNIRVLVYVKEYIQKILKNLDDPLSIIYLATIDKIKESGITGDIWEKI